MKNIDFNLENINSMISSDESLRSLFGLIDDMDLEIQSVDRS